MHVQLCMLIAACIDTTEFCVLNAACCKLAQKWVRWVCMIRAQKLDTTVHAALAVRCTDFSMCKVIVKKNA